MCGNAKTGNTMGSEPRSNTLTKVPKALADALKSAERPAIIVGGGALRYEGVHGAALASLVTAPLMWHALQQQRGAYWSFAVFMLLGAAVMYVYYSTVYPSIHDIVAPKARGTALSVYFLVFYVFLLVSMFWERPTHRMIGLGLISIGAIVYYLNAKPPVSDDAR